MRVVGPTALALGLCGATAMLVWFGYQATQQSAQRARLLLDRHVREQLALLWTGVTQDMKGAHATVLVPVSIAQLPVEPPYDLAEAFARGFARFPYPESFFVWRASGDSTEVNYVFNRADRLPGWHAPEPIDVPYPVVVLRSPSIGSLLVAEARQYATGRPSATFGLDIEGTRNQVVVSFQYHSEDRERLVGMVGFTVNLDWVRERYFSELTDQIARIGGLSGDVSLSILDESRRTVTATRPQSEGFDAIERAFPLAFVDRTSLWPVPPGQAFPLWTARAIAARDSQLAAAVGGSEAFVLMSVAAGAVLVGLLLTLRAVRVAAELTRMKSDFVTSVTHELKTPLTVIRLLADTLASGRYDTKAAGRTYATQLSRECRNLSSLIDHLMTWARLSHRPHAYTMERVDVGELIDDATDHFQALLAEQAFAVRVDVPPDLPAVVGDRTALHHAIDNLIDNAIKYSDGVRVLDIRAAAAGGQVTICVADHGVGIHPDDIGRVCDRFFRGRNVTVRGSGLGLAIARQIVDDHTGRLSIHSVPGSGTRVDMTLPAAGAG